MQNEKLVTRILNFLKTASHPLQIEQIQAALPEFKHLTDEDWYRTISDLLADSLIDASVVRSGIFGDIGAAYNIKITRRGRMLTPDSSTRQAQSFTDAAQTAKSRDVITNADDRRFAEMAIAEALRSVAEDERAHPKVGAVVVKNGNVLAVAHRGEILGSHAEYIALEEKLKNKIIAGSTIYTTLEPCTVRNDPKIACALRLTDRKVTRVVIGILDPNPAVLGKGWLILRDAGIETQFFPNDLMMQVEEMNRQFIREQRAKSKPTKELVKKENADGAKWTPNISQLTYINVPRISQIAGLEGIELALKDLPSFTFLNELGWELNRVMVAASKLINALDVQSTAMEKIRSADQELIGTIVSFSDFFRTKNGAKLYKARDKRKTLTFSGDLEHEPHIYRKLGSVKIVMLIDPRWVTSQTAFVQFSSGQHRFAGLCRVTSVEKELIMATLLILGTPKGPWDNLFRETTG